jgi:hypothetical protein
MRPPCRQALHDAELTEEILIVLQNIEHAPVGRGALDPTGMEACGLVGNACDLAATRGRTEVVVFSGLPGTGKSTLAERVARSMRAPAFSGDWLMGGLKPAHAALAKLDRSEYVAAWFGLLSTLVTRQLMLDQSAVVDAVVSDSRFALWHEIAGQFSARCQD